MRQKNKPKRRSPRSVLRLPDLDHSKSSVLQSLGSVASQRTYGFAIDDFISWYCSEPRLAFGRTVVLRYRYYLESRQLAPATINLRLAAVRRLAYEASDNGLLSPDLAAGIRRVKGAKRLGIRLGNWLTPEHARLSAGLVREGAKAAGRTTPTLYAYVRLALGPKAVEKLAEEGGRYAAIPAYGANFERMGVKPVDTCIAAQNASEVPPALAKWQGAVDEVVLRAITAEDTVEENTALLRAARPG